MIKLLLVLPLFSFIISAPEYAIQSGILGLICYLLHLKVFIHPKIAHWTSILLFIINLILMAGYLILYTT